MASVVVDGIGHQPFLVFAMSPGVSMARLPLILILVSVVPSGMKAAWGYHPRHPEVQAMVANAIAYLERLSDRDLTAGRWEGREYHSILVAYAHLKARKDLSSPVVKRGVREAKRIAAETRRNGGSLLGRARSQTEKSNYGVAIAIILLCEVDSVAHRTDIEVLRDGLVARQQAGGGFGYPGDDHGDTSQTQYVVLAIWAMTHRGIPVSSSIVDEVQQWLLRVQDPSGAWPYRATDPGPGRGPISQGSRKTHSTSLAAGGSLLIAGDFFGMWNPTRQREQLPPGMPKAVRPANSESPYYGNPEASTVDPRDVLGAINRMNQYRQQEPYNRGFASSWHYYAMYSTERFESFYELALDETDPEPDWYNEGVEDLKKNQAASGGWGVNDSASSPAPIATSFAILFLIRSTQSAIAVARSGSLAGGQGLPRDTTNITVDGTRIRGRADDRSVADLLGMLEDDTLDADISATTLPSDLKLATDAEQRRSQLQRLQRLVQSQSWEARRIATRLLGMSDEIEVVPTLIYALSDPDRKVRLYARDGLRAVSRKFDGFEMPDDPSPSQLERAEASWRQWYLTVDPNFVFLDD